ncbi:hypothetical protein V6N13_118416 [Hibiscus sabdariffa]
MTGAQHAMNSATGHQGGRLPDLIEVVEMPYMEDRPSLSVSPELQSVSKKGCGVGITAHEAIDLDMEVMDDDGDEELAPYKSLAGSEGRATTIPSFKDKLIGVNGGLGDVQYISELDVEVREEDVRVGGCY